MRRKEATKMKRLAALALSCCLAAGIFGGCGQKDEKEGPGQRTGKYVEEDVELPTAPGEEPWYLLKRADGRLELYTTAGETECGGRYLSEDGKEWTKDDASWLAANPDYTVMDLTAGADGWDYALVMDGEGKTVLLKENGQGKGEEIPLPVLEEPSGNGTEGMYLFGEALRVMENGNLALMGSDEVKVCDPAGQKVLHTFPYEQTELLGSCVADIRGGRLVLPGEGGESFAIWDVEKEKQEASALYGSPIKEGMVLLGDDGGLYFLNKDGLHHMNPEGSLVETLAEGSAMAMGDPNTYIQGFVQGNQEDFYALYYTDQGLLKHYYFDENASVGTQQELTVYSLEENDTVRQAISLFRQSHPQVTVSYKTGAADGAATRADQLRVLNTELLNKNGADILLLDGLPADSLMEKGVLADLSELINPLIEDGSIQKNIAECYRREDGKIYAMPLRYGIPIFYGKQELVEAGESLEKMEGWLKEHPEKLMAGLSYTELTELFVKLYEEELYKEDGSLSEEALSRCLSCIKMIGDRSDAEMENPYVEGMGAYGSVVMGSYPMGDPKEELLSAVEIKGMMDTMIPFQTIREKEYPLVYANSCFIPHGVAGINSSAKEPELAREFLQALFCEELQSFDLQDGLPVNPRAAEAVIGQGRDSLEDDSDTMGGVVTMTGADEDGAIDGSMESTINFSAPLKSELEEMFAQAAELKNPAAADSAVQDMIMEEAKAYYEGSQELEKAVQGIITRVDTYRAE